MPDFDPTLPHVVVHCHKQKCLGCQREFSYSHVFECVTNGKVKNLLPCRSRASFTVDTQIESRVMPVEYIVICHLCVATEPVADHEAHTRWQQTLMRKRAESTAASPTASNGANTNRVIPTLDML